MMISTMAPRDHFLPDGSIARATARLGRAARARSCSVAIMGDDGEFLRAGERGEIVVRGSL